jgi:hypothetical protein
VCAKNKWGWFKVSPARLLASKRIESTVASIEKRDGGYGDREIK